MGNKGSSTVEVAKERLEVRCGKIPVSGRYHKLPNKIEADYDLQNQVLGTGYNGVVRSATSRHGGTQKFAVKAFKIANVQPEKRRQLEDEVEIFLCMDHPHIIRLYDVYESEEFLHLVMECMGGGELYDRVMELKRFSEKDAAESVWQMLLALNYLHSHGIVHRDIKLENFLFENKAENHLKLIDFGFSKIWDLNTKMHVSCGTLSYVAPEVLEKCYTSQCDLWSLGVIVFILLAGYMPFSGKEATQTRSISEGNYKMNPERWSGISDEAKNFVQSLLQVDPDKRLTAQQALEHPFIANRTAKELQEGTVDSSVVEALRSFGKASKFRRCCMEMMAWSLSNEEREKVRTYFTTMDQNKQGTITLVELRNVLVKQFNVNDDETKAIFAALDTNQDEEIHYSDFLAAMVSTRIALHDGLLLSAFKKFDTDNSGYITTQNLKDILGDTFEGDEVDKLLAEADQLKDNRISYAEFVSYIRGTPLEAHQNAAAKIIDNQMNKKGASGLFTSMPSIPMLIKKQGSNEEKSPKKAGNPGESSTAEKAGDAKKESQPKCCGIQ